jgi:hypothetical protein
MSCHVEGRARSEGSDLGRDLRWGNMYIIGKRREGDFPALQITSSLSRRTEMI